MQMKMKIDTDTTAILSPIDLASELEVWVLQY